MHNLRNILNVPLQSTQPDQRLALKLLILTYGLPVAYKNQAAIRAAGNDILAATQPAFDKWGPFVGRLGQAIAMMQTIPAYNNNIRMSSADIARGYRRMAMINRILEAVGLVGGASAASAGAAQTIKTGSIDEGVRKIGGRMAGRGPVSEAIVERYGAASRGRVAGGVVVAAVAANLIYQSNKQQMSEFRALMQHRFQGGQAGREDYIAVFGDAIDPAAIRKYTEYR